MSSVSPPTSPKPPSTMMGTGPLRTNLRISARPTASTPIPPTLQAKLNAMMANRNVGAGAANAAAAAASSFRHMTPRRAPPPRLSGMSLGTFRGPSAGSPANGLGLGRPCSDFTETPFSRLSNIIDPSGVLRFRNTTLDSTGVRFSDGQTFSINMSELELREDVGRGVFGTVKRVLHRPTNAVLAMKEIRLELDDAKLNTIVMELDVLHRAVSPDIIDFYGGFFVEGCVYYCIEYMDAGSMDRIMLAYPGVPEPMLAYMLLSVVRGLKFLKDVLHIMHRDVKPTNVLMNTKGQVKLCDFGVSGQLEKSLARTHVGAQSYMAPERIDAGALGGNAGVLIGGSADAYTTAADVWSLGVTALEIARGAFPYAFDPKASALAQLIAIVDGPPPELPADGFSTEARDWVQRCLQKLPDRRATYAELLDHSFLRNQTVQQADASAWVNQALSRLSSGNIVGTSSP